MEFSDTLPTEPKVDVTANEATKGQSSDKTEEVIHKLENEIESVYNTIESKFSSLWSNASKSAQELQEKMNLEQRKNELIELLNNAKQNVSNNISLHAPTDGETGEEATQAKSLDSGVNFEAISTRANKALDTLDSKLEVVEQQAGKFMNLFSSFFSGIVAIDQPPKAAPVETEKSQIVSFPNSYYGSTRYDAELYRLHTTESSYLNNADKGVSELEAFDVLTKTTEISSLLKKYPETLERLMNQIVPVKISYKEFWFWYFKAEDELKNNEEKRRQLLAKKDDESQTEATADADDDDDEEFTWDDDEDDEAGAEVK